MMNADEGIERYYEIGTREPSKAWCNVYLLGLGAMGAAKTGRPVVTPSWPDVRKADPPELRRKPPKENENA